MQTRRPAQACAGQATIFTVFGPGGFPIPIVRPCMNLDEETTGNKAFMGGKADLSVAAPYSSSVHVIKSGVEHQPLISFLMYQFGVTKESLLGQKATNGNGAHHDAVCPSGNFYNICETNRKLPAHVLVHYDVRCGEIQLRSSEAQLSDPMIQACLTIMVLEMLGELGPNKHAYTMGFKGLEQLTVAEYQRDLHRWFKSSEKESKHIEKLEKLDFTNMLLENRVESMEAEMKSMEAERKKHIEEKSVLVDRLEENKQYLEERQKTFQANMWKFDECRSLLKFFKEQSEKDTVKLDWYWSNLEKSNAELKKSNAELEEKDAELEEKDAELAVLREAVAELAVLREAVAELEEKDAELAVLREAVAELEEKEKDAELAVLREAVAELFEIDCEKDAELADRNTHMEALEDELAQLRSCAHVSCQMVDRTELVVQPSEKDMQLFQPAKPDTHLEPSDEFAPQPLKCVLTPETRVWAFVPVECGQATHMKGVMAKPLYGQDLGNKVDLWSSKLTYMTVYATLRELSESATPGWVVFE